MRREPVYGTVIQRGVMEKKVVEVTGDKSVTSISRYDRMGNLVYEDDGLGNISSFTYDYLGRLTGASYSEGGILSEISRVNDANGTLIREVEKDGTVIAYTYDARNQMVKKVLSKGSMSRTYLTEYGFEWRDRENSKSEQRIRGLGRKYRAECRSGKWQDSSHRYGIPVR